MAGIFTLPIFPPTDGCFCQYEAEFNILMIEGQALNLRIIVAGVPDGPDAVNIQKAFGCHSASSLKR